MTATDQLQTITVICTECRFSKEVEKSGNRPAEVLIEHGQERGHKLTLEKSDSEG